MSSEDKIAIITYDFPHRKTQDIVFGLKAKAYQKVKLFALPFVERENPFKPIYTHRPTACFPIYPKDLSLNFGYDFQQVAVDELNASFLDFNPDAILIAGAGLLPSEVVLNHNLINSHPAYLPEVRGLDALKWAIINQNTIGVTTHFVNELADAGRMIDRKKMNVYKNDTFHSLAYRQYRMEIDMLLEALEIIKKKTTFPNLESDAKVNRRMPKSIEKNLLAAFQSYLSSFAIE